MPYPGNSDNGNDNFDIDLRRYYVMLAKDPILQSFLVDNPAEDTELGNNAVRVPMMLQPKSYDKNNPGRCAGVI